MITKRDCPIQGQSLSFVRLAGSTCLRVIMNEVNESLLSTRQGEGLAEGQLRDREVIVGRMPMAKRWPDEQESHRRHGRWMSRQRTVKSDTCTENGHVYAAGISVKAGAHYPGRSGMLSRQATTRAERSMEDISEVSRGHNSPHRSRMKDRTEIRQRGTQP